MPNNVSKEDDFNIDRVNHIYIFKNPHKDSNFEQMEKEARIINLKHKEHRDKSMKKNKFK